MNKSQRKKEVQALIDSIPVGAAFVDAEVVALNALLGTEFTTFSRERNVFYPSDPRHLHADGRCFSWNSAITRPDGLPYERHKAFALLRGAVEYQIQDAKQFLKWGCPCGAQDNLQVDHASPPFARIAAEFIVDFGPPEYYDGVCGSGGALSSLEYAALWRGRHFVTATYQVLCRSCNARKGVK